MSISLIGLALVAGVVTLLSPCILPILPILVGRSLQNHRWGPMALIGGLVISFACTGVLLGFSAQFLGPLSQFIRQLAIGILLILGIGSMFPHLSHRVWQWITPQLGKPVDPETGSGHLWAEFLIGTQLGVVWIPCAGPILGSILTLVVADQELLLGFLALLAYGLGAGVPMLAFAYGSKGILQRVRGLYPHMEMIQRVSGVAIAVTAVGILLRWDVQIQLWLVPLFPPLPL